MFSQWTTFFIDENWCFSPNTSRYPVSGRLIFTIVVFLRYGPRTRPAILFRGGCSYKRQFLCFFEMGPEHAPLPCVGQVVLTIVVLLTYGLRARPAILSRGGCSLGGCKAARLGSGGAGTGIGNKRKHRSKLKQEESTTAN